MKALKKEFESNKEKKKEGSSRRKKKRGGERDINCMEGTAVCYTRLTPHRDL